MAISGLSSAFSNSTKSIYFVILITQKDEVSGSASSYASIASVSGITGAPSTGKDYFTLKSMSDITRQLDSSGFGLSPASGFEFEILTSGPSEPSSIYQTIYADLVNPQKSYSVALMVSADSTVYSNFDPIFTGYVDNVEMHWNSIAFTVKSWQIKEDATVPKKFIEDVVADPTTIPVQTRSKRVPLVYGPWDYLPMLYYNKNLITLNYYLDTEALVAPAATSQNKFPHVFEQNNNDFVPFYMGSSALTMGSGNKTTSGSNSTLFTMGGNSVLEFSSLGSTVSYNVHTDSNIVSTHGGEAIVNNSFKFRDSSYRAGVSWAFEPSGSLELHSVSVFIASKTGVLDSAEYIFVEIYEQNPTYRNQDYTPSDHWGVGEGTYLGKSDNVSLDRVSVGEYLDFDFSTPVSLSGGGLYVFKLYTPESGGMTIDTSNYFSIGNFKSDSVYIAGDFAYLNEIDVVASGTCDAGSTSTTIVLASADVTAADTYNGYRISLTGGTGAGQTNFFTYHAVGGTASSVLNTWTTTPDNTTTYQIFGYDQVNIYNEWVVYRIKAFYAATYSNVTSPENCIGDTSSVTGDMYTGGDGKWLFLKMPQIEGAEKNLSMRIAVELENDPTYASGENAVAKWKADFFDPKKDGEVTNADNSILFEDGTLATSEFSGYSDLITSASTSGVNGSYEFYFDVDSQTVVSLPDSLQITSISLTEDLISRSSNEIGFFYTGTNPFGVKYIRITQFSYKSQDTYANSKQLWLRVGDSYTGTGGGRSVTGDIRSADDCIEHFLDTETGLGSGNATFDTSTDSLFEASSLDTDQEDFYHCGLNEAFFVPNTTSTTAINGTNTKVAIPFTTEATAKTVEAVMSYLTWDSSESWSDQAFVFEIWSDSAGSPSAIVGSSTGTFALYDGTINGMKQFRAQGHGWCGVKFSTPVSGLSNSTQYWVVITRSGTWGSDCGAVKSSQQNTTLYTGAAKYYDGSWNTLSSDPKYYCLTVRETHTYQTISFGLGPGYRKESNTLLSEVGNIANQLNWRLGYNESGAWKSRVWSAVTTSVKTFDQSNIYSMEKISYDLTEKKISKLRYRYNFDLRKKDFTKVISIEDLYTTPRLSHELTVEADAVYDDAQARWHAFVRHLYTYRRKMVIEFTTDTSGLLLEEGDVIRVDHPLLYNASSYALFEVQIVRISLLGNKILVVAKEQLIA